MKGITIRDLMEDPKLFGNQFGADSFTAWRALLCGFYGLELTPDELEHWQAVTGRTGPPTAPSEELWLAVGRRGGKSQAAALIAVFEAFFSDFRPRLAPGEVATVMVLAADRRQARNVFRFITGLVDSVPMLSVAVTRRDRETLELTNRAAIEVHTASFRSTRGYTAAAVIADEIAFWRSEDSANPDHEIIAALRPALATLGGPLIALSSPYAKRGELWQAYRQHYGQEDSSVLVAKAASQALNPLIPQRVIDEAYDRDPDSAASEYGGEFRNDISAFIDREQIDRLMRPEPLELPPQRGIRYMAFTDATGGGRGSNADEFTLAIGHKCPRTGFVVVDLVRGMKGKSPKEIIREYCVLLRHYGLREVSGDRYAGYFAHDAFAEHGIRYKFTEERRTGLYQFALGVINSHGVELPPSEKLATQFSQLERRVSRSGMELIDHPPGKGSHDDWANAVAGLIFTASRVREVPKVTIKWLP